MYFLSKNNKAWRYRL